MVFYPAEQLRKEFEVSASFYQIKVGNKLYQCRDHALIKRKGTNSQQPDAVIIMANPGSCSPNDKDSELPIIQKHPAKCSYVDVNVDPTQYQLMRLMKMMDWNLFSIINLSDLCSGNMNDFQKKLNEVEQNHYYNHSIFSEERIEELEKMLFNSNTEIILAWGQHPSIRTLVCNAKKILIEKYQIVGLPSPNTKCGYRHPFPMIQVKCIKWLDDMYNLLTQDTTEDIISQQN